MYKFFAISLFFLTSLAYAQDYYFKPPSEQKSSLPKVQLPARHPISSPEDFKKTVTSLSQQSEDNLSQQAAQKMKNLTNQPPATTNTVAPTTPTQQQTPPNIQPDYPSNVQSAPAPTTPANGSARPTFPERTEQPQQAAPTFNQTPQEQQPYTGFPSGNSTGGSTNNPAPSQQNSGGWNIQY